MTIKRYEGERAFLFRQPLDATRVLQMHCRCLAEASRSEGGRLGGVPLEALGERKMQVLSYSAKKVRYRQGAVPDRVSFVHFLEGAEHPSFSLKTGQCRSGDAAKVRARVAREVVARVRPERQVLIGIYRLSQ